PQPSSYNPPKRIPRFNHPSRLLAVTANSIIAAPSRCLLSEEACRHPGLTSLI
ncbi:uncharacterized protein BKA55DRAFT_629436, partial [Fusarium redolens]